MDYTIVKVVQTSHHQVNIRYGTFRCMQCSYLSLVSVSWALLKSHGLWDKFDLDCILGKGNQLIKFIDKFRYLGIEDLPQEFLRENSSINVKFLENEKGEIKAGTYLLSIAEIVYCAQQIGGNLSPVEYSTENIQHIQNKGNLHH